MSGAGDLSLGVHGERLWLLPERAIFWEDRRLLLIADPHWGKAAAFRAGGIPVPGGTTREGLARLSHALVRTGARGVVVLGDFLHARSGRAPGTLRTLEEWRAAHRELEMLLVRGNHDRHAGDPPESLGIECVDGPVGMGPFRLSHHPVAASAGYGLAGHVHPAVRLTGRARERQRLPCFWFAPGGAILPAFGEFTGAADISPAPGDRVFVVAEGAVVEVPV